MWKHVASTARNDNQCSHTVGARRNFVRLAIMVSDVHGLQEAMQQKNIKKRERTKKTQKQRQREQGVYMSVKQMYMLITPLW